MARLPSTMYGQLRPCLIPPEHRSEPTSALGVPRKVSLHGRRPIQQVAGSRDTAAIGCCRTDLRSLDWRSWAWPFSAAGQGIHSQRALQGRVCRVLVISAPCCIRKLWRCDHKTAGFQAYCTHSAEEPEARIHIASHPCKAWPRRLRSRNMAAFLAQLPSVPRWLNSSRRIHRCRICKPLVLGPNGKRSARGVWAKGSIRPPLSRAMTASGGAMALAIPPLVNPGPALRFDQSTVEGTLHLREAKSYGRLRG